MRLTTRTIAALATTGLLANAAAVGTGTAASATTPSHSGSTGSSHDRGLPGGEAVGLSADGTRLSTFSLKVPALARDHGRIAGLAGDTRLVGIDWRVQDRTVYGVGDAGGVYTLDVRRAKATKVSQLTAALAGTHFGVDFNPAADRLRVISDTGHRRSPGRSRLPSTTASRPRCAPRGRVARRGDPATRTRPSLGARGGGCPCRRGGRRGRRGRGPARNPRRAPVLAVRQVTTAPGVTATAGLVDHTWGVELKLVATGLPAGRAYDVRIVDDGGREFDSGAFLGVDRTVTCSMNASVLLADPARFEVLDPAGAVVISGPIAS